MSRWSDDEDDGGRRDWRRDRESHGGRRLDSGREDFGRRPGPEREDFGRRPGPGPERDAFGRDVMPPSIRRHSRSRSRTPEREPRRRFSSVSPPRQRPRSREREEWGGPGGRGGGPPRRRRSSPYGRGPPPPMPRGGGGFNERGRSPGRRGDWGREPEFDDRERSRGRPRDRRDDRSRDRERRSESEGPPPPGVRGMMTLKQFISTMPEDMDDNEIVAKYSEYKEAHTKRQITEFFNQHADEAWFQELYHPVVHEEFESLQREHAQLRLEVFKEKGAGLGGLINDIDHQDDVIAFIQDVRAEVERRLEKAAKAAAATTKNVGAEGEGEDAGAEGEQGGDGQRESGRRVRRESTSSAFGKPRDGSNIMFIKNVAPFISRTDVRKFCEEVGVVVRVTLSEPTLAREYIRQAWVTFSHDTDIRQVAKELDNKKLKEFTMRCMPSKAKDTRVRSTPVTDPQSDRLSRDLKQTENLIHMLDRRRQLFDGEEKNPYLADPSEAEEGRSSLQAKLRALDTRVIYLRLVHNCCYYSGVLADDEEDLVRRTCNAFVRGKDLRHVDPYFWRELDDRIESLLREKLTSTEAHSLGLMDAEQEVNAEITKLITQLDKEKYKCELCQKMFKGAEFVRKHIANKHAENVALIRDKCGLFNNYVLDPNRPTLTSALGEPMGPMPGRGPGGGGPMPMMHMPPPFFHGPGPFPPNGPPRGPLLPMGPMGPMGPPPPFMGGPPMRGPGGPMFGRGGRHHDRFRPYPRGGPPDMMGPPPPPPPGAMLDPRAERGLINYLDLDAPQDAGARTDFREMVNYGDL